MIDPITAFTMASGAFSAIKKLVETGREIEDVAGYFGKFFEGASALKEAKSKAENPSTFRRLLDKGTVEQEALEATIHTQKLLQMERELRELICYHYGEDVYVEMMRNRERIRQRRVREELAAQAARENAIAIGGIVALTGIVGFLIYMAVSMALEAK